MISFVFWSFVAVVFLALYACDKLIENDTKSVSIANWVLIVASYIFVAYVDYRFVIVLALLTVSTWFFAKKKAFSFIGIIIPLIALTFFKYANFFAESFGKFFGFDHSSFNVVLPIGISFYTFSAIGYVIDVKRNRIQARELKDVALYLSFFPKIISGPIQRSDDFFKQIDLKRNHGWGAFYPSFSQGIQVFMFGLFKKIVLADRLSVFVNQVYETPMAFGSMTVFLAAVAYSFQIYFDFSGYSDMAIGVAKILGFNLPRNFNLPYLAHNATELWKRWHITLSSWLRDYLYISLGGNRKGTFRTYINLILTMFLGGIWHGANWTYVVWGLLHGLALAIHKAWMKITDSPNRKHSFLMNALSILLTFLFTTFSWIFFRADSLSQARIIITRIFSFQSGIEQPYIWLFVAIGVFIICSIIALTKSVDKKTQIQKQNTSFINGYYPVLNLNAFWSLVLFFVFFGLILCLAYTGGSPFIYGNY